MQTRGPPRPIDLPRGLLEHLPLWEWCDSVGVFTAYDDGNRMELETAYLERSHETLLLSSRGVKVQVDMSSLTQRVVHDDGRLGPEGSVRRTEKGHVHEPTWTTQAADPAVVDVPAGTVDATMAVDLVLGSPASGRLDPRLFAIISVQRVENHGMRRRYLLERAEMIRERGAGNINEKVLYHGTRKHVPEVIAIDRDGFMAERAGDCALYGKGCYFAETPRYSWNYAHWCDGVPTGRRQFVLADVLCGVAREMGSQIDREGAQCNRAWLRDHGFDSVRGGPHFPRGSTLRVDSSSMVVVYRPHQAYPRLIVSVAPIGIARQFPAYEALLENPQDGDVARSTSGRDVSRPTSGAPILDPQADNQGRSKRIKVTVPDVFHIGPRIDPVALADALAVVGPVDDTVVDGDCAWITFQNPKDALKAVMVADGQMLDCRALRVVMDDGPSAAGVGARGVGALTTANTGGSRESCRQVKIFAIDGFDLSLQWDHIDFAAAFAEGGAERACVCGDCAWILFREPEDARAAVATFDFGDLDGRAIRVIIDDSSRWPRAGTELGRECSQCWRSSEFGHHGSGLFHDQWFCRDCWSEWENS